MHSHMHALTYGLTIGQLATLVLGPEGSTVDLDLKQGERFLKVCALRPCLISSMLRGEESKDRVE
jgi:hypothetical protein